MTAENLLNGYVRKGQLKSRKRVWLVHRLDRGTSGVMMFVKSEELAEAVRSEWNRLTVKRYLARVDGELEAKEGFFESYLSDNPRTMKVSSVSDPKLGKLARTEWRTLSKSAGTTLVEVTLKSGRKNQIRVHFAESGHPVVGDAKYGKSKTGQLCLHAWKLAFIHPHSGKRLAFETGLPKFAQRLLPAAGDPRGQTRSADGHDTAADVADFQQHRPCVQPRAESGDQHRPPASGIGQRQRRRT
jgi:tRNA pseudouridine32 synthase/23S rRNA pseudouridine746 synthase/23S rRNA pseudouridine1911/1915/1917 synthase